LIIYPSSAAVYGDPEMLPTNEDAELRPISPYGFHKLICEVLAREYNQCFGLKVVCCRYFSVFGAEQRRLLIWDLYEKLRSGTPSIELRGTGKESRDFLLVDDLANATVAVATKALSTQNAFPDVLNIASGSEISIAEVSEVMREITGAKDVTVNFDQRRSNIDPAKWRADISLFQSTVGELRNRGFQKVLEMTVKTWDEQGKQKSADIM
jgi:UDP-glucose 4-epimerase